MDFASLPDVVVFNILGMLPSVYDALRLRCACWPALSDAPPTRAETELLCSLEAMPIQQSESFMREKQIRLGVDTLTRFRREDRKRRERQKAEAKRREKKAKDKARRDAKMANGGSAVKQKPKKTQARPQKLKPKAKRAKRKPWDGQGVTVKKMNVRLNSNFSDLGFAHA